MKNKLARKYCRLTDIMYWLAFGATPKQIVAACNLEPIEVWAASAVVDLKGRNIVKRIRSGK